MKKLHPHVQMSGRRRFLQGLSATALAAPFLRAHTAQAGGDPPKNLLLVTWPEGLETGWQPQRKGASYEFTDVLAPLNPFVSKLTVLDGIKGGTGNIILQHSEGTLSMWTGDTPTFLQNLSQLPSLDQIVAQKLGSATPFRSLHFGSQTNRASAISNPYVHYAGKDQPIPAEDDPAVMYDLIFGGSSKDAASAEKVRAQQKSVLDFVTGRLKDVRARVAAEDRVKLDKHEDSIRSLEKGLAGLSGGCGPAPSRPSQSGAAALSDANFADVIKLQTDLIALSLQCGLTRVATLQLSNTDSQTRIPGLSTMRTVHEAMHAGVREERVEINRFFARQLAYVLERLSKVDVGPGRTLLDDTLVVMSSEMAVGGHWNEPIPFLLAGNGGGRLKMGQYLILPERPRHTQALTSIAHTFGALEGQTVGAFKGSDSEGPLRALMS